MRHRLSTLLLLLACSSSPTSEEGDLLLRTDARTYFPGAAITATIVNGARDTAFVSHCNFRPVLRVERRVAGSWTQMTQINDPCPAMYPSGELRIEPDGTLAESVSIESEGEYRLLTYARWGWQDFGDVVAYSSPFTVRFPPD